MDFSSPATGIKPRVKPTERLTVSRAIRLLERVRLNHFGAAVGLEINPKFAERTLKEHTAFIFYIGPGFGAFLNANRDGTTHRETPIGPGVAIEAITFQDPGIYWGLNLTVRLDRGRPIELANNIDVKLLGPQDQRNALSSWVLEQRRQLKGFAFLYSKSYWERSGGITRTVQRLRRAADRSYAYLGKEFSTQIEQLLDLTRIEIVEMILNSLVVAVLGRIPVIGQAVGFMDDAQSASRLGIAGGMAAWGTSDEDIEVSARLIAREVGEFLLGEGVKVLGKGAGKAREAIGKRERIKPSRGTQQETELTEVAPLPPRRVREEPKAEGPYSRGNTEPRTSDRAVSDIRTNAKETENKALESKGTGAKTVGEGKRRLLHRGPYPPDLVRPPRDVPTPRSGIVHDPGYEGRRSFGDPVRGMYTRPTFDYSDENIQRMLLGHPPKGSDNQPVQLHHRNRQSGGPLDEYTRTKHQELSRILHGEFGQPRGDGSEKVWAEQRARYWVSRAREILGTDPWD